MCDKIQLSGLVILNLFQVCTLSKYRKMSLPEKYPNTEHFLVRIFLYSNWMRRFTEIFPSWPLVLWSYWKLFSDVNVQRDENHYHNRKYLWCMHPIWLPLKTEKKEQTKNFKGCVADLKSSDIFRESLICLSFEE